MTTKNSVRKEPAPTRTRTDQDRIMIIVGITLVLVFVTMIYLGLINEKSGSGLKPRGPVKNPHSSLQYFEPKSSIYRMSVSKIKKRPEYSSFHYNID